MSFMKEHPIVTLVVGIGIGLAFGTQLRRLPILKQVPSV